MARAKEPKFDWPRGVSNKAAVLLEAAGWTPETAQGAPVEILMRTNGVSKSSAAAAVAEPLPDEIQLVRSITGRFPGKDTWEVLCREIAKHDEGDLREAWAEHVLSGRSRVDYIGWLRKAKVKADSREYGGSVAIIAKPSGGHANGTAAGIKKLPNDYEFDKLVDRFIEEGVPAAVAYQAALAQYG